MNDQGQNIITKIYEQFLCSGSNNIILIAHQKPDGDALGSVLALRGWLVGLGKNASVFCLDPIEEQYYFLPGADSVSNDIGLFDKQWDLLVTCDSSDLDYAGIKNLLDGRKNLTLINIDHHQSNYLFGNYNLVNGKASSTAEVIYDFFIHNDITINKDTAVCLLTGIYTDTNGFSNAATSSHTMRVAAHLNELGASLPRINRATISNKTLQNVRFWGKIMSRLTQTSRGVSYTYVLNRDFKDYNLSLDHVSGLSNYLSHLKDTKALIVFVEREDGTVKASLRTVYDGIDLSRLSRAMGGGGHKKAAGFVMRGKLNFDSNGNLFID